MNGDDQQPLPQIREPVEAGNLRDLVSAVAAELKRQLQRQPVREYTPWLSFDESMLRPICLGCSMRVAL